MISFDKIYRSNKTIAIMGATGNQGGATVKAFHALKESGNNHYKIRAISRDPHSEKAEAIKPLVDEIVKADANNIDEMVAAFEGCYGAFLVSDFWQDMNVSNEMRVLRNLKEAVKKAGVKHVVLSTLEDTRPFVTEQEDKDSWAVIEEEHNMYVPHLDGKNEVEQEFREEGIPTTYFYTAFYYENFINFGMGPSRQADTAPYGITFPMGSAKLAMVAVADIGKMVCAIFQDPSLIGEDVGVASEILTGAEVAATFEKVCGQKVLYNAVPWEVYASFGFPGAGELANMFRYFKEDAERLCGLRDVPDDRQEKMGGLIALEDWVTENKAAFVLGDIVEVDEATKGTVQQETAPLPTASGQAECCTCVLM